MTVTVTVTMTVTVTAVTVTMHREHKMCDKADSESGPCADLPPPFSSGRRGPWWRVAPVVSCLALAKGPGNSSISLVDLFCLK